MVGRRAAKAAPSKLKSIPKKSIEYVELSAEVITLRDAYLRAEIVGRRWIDDAAHVAAASVIGADAIVSRNFRHIVRVDRIGRYNDVNIARALPGFDDCDAAGDYP
jgi:hypothetical protein